MQQFRQIVTQKTKDDFKKIDEKIKNEKDPYKRAKLHEQKLMYDLFSNFSSSYEKYKNPW